MFSILFDIGVMPVIPMIMTMMNQTTDPDPNRSQVHHLARQTIPIIAMRLENRHQRVENAHKRSTQFPMMMMTI